MQERRDIRGLVRLNLVVYQRSKKNIIIVTNGAKILVDLFVCQAFVIAYECATYT